VGPLSFDEHFSVRENTRGWSGGHARDLKPLFEITPGRLAKCLLPQTANGQDGQPLFTRPTSYDPPKP
jgi:hypothetical protein